MKPESRILFSIAHELGHLILHLLKPDGSIQECTTLHRGAQSTRKELEANEFAKTTHSNNELEANLFAP